MVNWGQSTSKGTQEVHSLAALLPEYSETKALAKGLAQHGEIDEALQFFWEMPDRDMIGWNTMITAYAQCGQLKEAFFPYEGMLLDGKNPDATTFVSVLNACAKQATLAKGKQVHASMVSSNIIGDIILEDTLVNMYGKCGNIDKACAVFDRMPMKDLVSWNEIIMTYGQHGHVKDAFILQCMQAQGMKPYEITLINVLSACSHAGLISDGCHLLT